MSVSTAGSTPSGATGRRAGRGSTVRRSGWLAATVLVLASLWAPLPSTAAANPPVAVMPNQAVVNQAAAPLPQQARAPAQCNTGKVVGLRPTSNANTQWEIVEFDPTGTPSGTPPTTGLGQITAATVTVFDALGLSADGSKAYYFERKSGEKGERPTLSRMDLTTGTITSFTTTTRLASDSWGGIKAGAVDPVSGIYYYAHVDYNDKWWLYGWDTTTDTPIGVLGTFTPKGGSNGDLAFDGDGNLFLAHAPSSGTPRGLWRVAAADVPTLPSTAALAITTAPLGSTMSAVGMAYTGPVGPFTTDSLFLTTGTSSPANLSRTDPAAFGQPAFTDSRTLTNLTDLASCAQDLNVITLGKTITSRVGATDQFKVTIARGAETASATTTGTALGAQPQRATLMATPGTYTLSEAAIPAASLAGYSQTLTCTLRGGGAVPVSGTGATRTITFTSGAVDCQWTNKAPPTLTVTKTFPSGRYLGSDQVTVQIRANAANGAVQPAVSGSNPTTAGSLGIVTPNTGTTGAFRTTNGTSYVITEVGANSQTNLENYTTREITCVDPTGLQPSLPTNATFGSSYSLGAVVDGAQVSCILANTRKAPPVTTTGLACDTGYVYGTSGRSTVSVGDAVWRINTQTGVATRISNLTTDLTTVSGGTANGFAITPDGRTGYYVSSTAAPGTGTGTGVAGVFKIDFTQPVASRLGEEMDTLSIRGLAGGIVRGGINPTNGIFYFSNTANANAGSLDQALHHFYAYDTLTDTMIGYVGTIGGGPFGLSGDLVFDQTGNMILLTSDSRLAPIQPISQLWRVSNMPTAAAHSGGGPGTQVLLSATDVPRTLLTSWSTPPSTAGVTFDADGYLYVQGTTSDPTSSWMERVDPNNGDRQTKPDITATNWPTGQWISDLADCNDPGALRLKKNIVGRAATNDQFNLVVTRANPGNMGGNTAVTSGNTLGVQTAVAGPVIGVPGVTYILRETKTSGNLNAYDISIRCIDLVDGHEVFPTSTGVVGEHQLVFPQATGPLPYRQLADIECTYTNAPITRLSVIKALGTARAVSTDQFSVWARTDLGPAGTDLPTVSPANRTTTGSTGTGTGTNRGVTGAMPVIPGTTYYVGERAAPSTTTDLSLYTTVITCTDAKGVQTGLPNAEPYTEPVAITPVVGSQITCTITNRVDTTITLTKALAGSRVVPADQFKVEIRYPAATIVSSSGTPTTAGTGSDIITGTGTSTWNVTTPGQPVTLTEIKAGGTTMLAGYDTSIACDNLRSASTTALPSGAGQSFTVSPVAGDRIRCILTNSAEPNLATKKELFQVNGDVPGPAVKAGDVLTYRMTVTNTGKASGSTTLTETVPQFTTFTGAGWTGCTASPASPQNTVCTTVVTVAPGASQTVDFQVKVNPNTEVVPTPAGNWLPVGTQQLTNAVTSSDGTCESCEVVTPLSPVLKAVKTLTAVNGAAVPVAFTAKAGDRLRYTITVTNTGGQPGTAFLTETVPKGTGFAGPAGTWTGCAASPATQHPAECLWTGSVPAPIGTDAGKVEVPFEVIVLDPLPSDVTEILNVVRATDQGGTSICPVEDNDPLTPNCTVVTPLTAAWTMTKTAARGAELLADGATVRSGETITYTVTATALRGTITDLRLYDNLSGVLGAGTFGAGTVTVAGGTPTPIAPAANSSLLIVSVPTLTAPQTVVLSYTVTVKARVSLEKLRNVATGSGSVPPDRCPAVGGRGVDAVGCFTEQITPAYLMIQKLTDGLAGQQPVTLAGAEFAILTDVAGAPGAPIGTPVVAVANATGRFEVDGISPGSYWLRETKAPAGHNLLAQDVPFTLAADGTVTTAPGHGQVDVVDLGGKVVVIQVTDTTPFALPLTGGAGTGWISTVGLALLAGAMALLLLPVVRRRRTV